MKFDYKSYSNHLESENERLNGIIDELEDLNEDYLTENFLLNVKINKVRELLEEFDYKRNTQDDLLEFISYIILYLGDKENEDIKR